MLLNLKKHPGTVLTLAILLLLPFVVGLIEGDSIPDRACRLVRGREWPR